MLQGYDFAADADSIHSNAVGLAGADVDILKILTVQPQRYYTEVRLLLSLYHNFLMLLEIVDYFHCLLFHNLGTTVGSKQIALAFNDCRAAAFFSVAPQDTHFLYHSKTGFERKIVSKITSGTVYNEFLHCLIMSQLSSVAVMPGHPKVC